MESILAKCWMCTHGRILRYTKKCLWTRQTKWLAKGNPEEIPHISNKLLWGYDSMAHSVSACLSIHMYCTFFFLRNTCSLLSFFVRILFMKSQRARVLSLATGLVARIWCSHYFYLSLWPGTEDLLQVTAGQGHPRSSSSALNFLNCLSGEGTNL